MTRRIAIDFVSDILCPWCVVGLIGLDQALARASDVVTAKIRFHPYELDPEIPAAGVVGLDYIRDKFGAVPDHYAAGREIVRGRAAALGFTMNLSERSRVFNSFDAHRLIHWAEARGRAKAVKLRLFTAYFTENDDISDHRLLAALAGKVGLDECEAFAMLKENEGTDAVRQAEQAWLMRGVRSVPLMIIDGRHALSGGQPPEMIEAELRRIASA